MMHDDNNVATITGLTAEIVAAYVSHHGVATADFGRLIAAVGKELGGLGRVPEPPAKALPAVPVRRSVRDDHLVCLVCGKPFKSLRRHLRTSHALTPQAYREKFELGGDYPMVAAASTERRVEIARRSGLGQRRLPEPELAAQPAREDTNPAAPQATPKPVRGRRTPKKADLVPA